MVSQGRIQQIVKVISRLMDIQGDNHALSSFDQWCGVGAARLHVILCWSVSCMVFIPVSS